MLPPVLDSLMSFFERALGRPITVGVNASMSDDEDLLISVVQGSESLSCINCAPHPDGQADRGLLRLRQPGSRQGWAWNSTRTKCEAMGLTADHER